MSLTSLFAFDNDMKSYYMPDYLHAQSSVRWNLSGNSYSTENIDLLLVVDYFRTLIHVHILKKTSGGIINFFQQQTPIPQLLTTKQYCHNSMNDKELDHHKTSQLIKSEHTEH